jgi:ERCC4-type nuclease
MGYLPKKPRKSVRNNLTIYYDDREKTPWIFNGFKYPITMERKRLITGDYTIKGYMDKIVIERKHGINEIIMNISALDRARFVKELERLAQFKCKYLVIEDCISNTNIALKKLPNRVRITADSVYYWLTKIQCYYRIPIIWLGKTPRMQQQILHKFWEHVFEVDLNRRD